jgi:hypothetical protein
VDEVRRWGVHDRRFLLEIDATAGKPEGPFRIDAEQTAGAVRKLTLVMEGDAGLDDLLRSVMAQGIAIRACDRIEPDLEMAFSRILDAQEDAE